MNDDEKEVVVNVTVTDTNKPIEVVLRKGDAPDINVPVAFRVGRNISLQSIAEYVGKKAWAEDINERKALVVFSRDPDNAYISFQANPNDPLAISMEAKLIDNPDFTDFGINKGKVFSQELLELFVKSHAHCFEDIETAKLLIKNLQNFEAVYQQHVIKEDNRQGEKKDAVTSSIKMAKGELPTSLKLKMPLFKFQPPVEFEVEVEVDKIKGSNLPGFSFYSLDIELLKRDQVEKLIMEPVEALQLQFVALEA